MSEEHVDTGFDLVGTTPAVQPVPEGEGIIQADPAPVEPVAPVAVKPDLGPTVADLLAAQAPSETDAERAFAEPIKILEPHESLAAQSNREFYEKLQARRNVPPAVPVPQPVAKRITDQTLAEMAEGARISAVHAERSRVIPRPRPSASEVAAQGTTTPVFRPADYVPGQNQGDVRAQPLT